MPAGNAEIVAVFAKYGFVDAVRALHLTPYLHAGRRMLGARICFRRICSPSLRHCRTILARLRRRWTTP
jgi:hypothetical protein